MRRRVLGALLIVVVSSLHALAIVRAASGLSCACIKAACCCGPKRPAPGAGCHGMAGAAERGLRCRHSTDALLLAATIGVSPPDVFPGPTLTTAEGVEGAAGSARDGFSRLYAPPPRPLDAPA
jgi:hypothetical protein